MARLIEKRLKEKVAPLDDNEMRMLRENVRQPYLLGAVLKTNDQLVAARKAAEAIVTPDPRPLADLTDGEEISERSWSPIVDASSTSTCGERGAPHARR